MQYFLKACIILCWEEPAGPGALVTPSPKGPVQVSEHAHSGLFNVEYALLVSSLFHQSWIGHEPPKLTPEKIALEARYWVLAIALKSLHPGSVNAIFYIVELIYLRMSFTSCTDPNRYDQYIYIYYLYISFDN